MKHINEKRAIYREAESFFITKTVNEDGDGGYVQAAWDTEYTNMMNASLLNVKRDTFSPNCGNTSSKFYYGMDDTCWEYETIDEVISANPNHKFDHDMVFREEKV